MEKKLPKINIIQDAPKFRMPRKDQKKKAPVLDPRRGSRIAADAVTAVIVDRLKSIKDVEIITNALNKHFIFTSLSAENRVMVISQMKLYTMGPQERVFEQGSPGSTFFVISSGKIEVVVNGKLVNVLGPGDSFGELALLHDSPRSASVMTADKVAMWGLDRKTFRSAVETVNASNYKENKSFIDTVPLFSVLTHVQRDALVGALSTLKYRPGEVIVKEGDPGDLFYIIKEGTVTCNQGNKTLRQMTKGSFFGEQALLYSTVRTATVIANNDVKCVAISRNKLTAALGQHLQQIIYQNTKMIAFEKSESLRHLNKRQQTKLIEKMKVASYQDREKVIKAGTKIGSVLKIVLFGTVVSQNNKIGVFDMIGDTLVWGDDCGVYENDWLAEGETHMAEITKEEVFECVEGSSSSLSVEALNTLRGIQLLRNLSYDQFISLTGCLKMKSFEDGSVIIEQNTEGDSFFLIENGKVDIVQDGVNLRTVAKHDYFGERSVLFNDQRTASVIANGEVKCWYLTKNDFFRFLEENVRNLLIKRIEMQDDAISLNQLVIVRELGKGMFGNVFLVADKQKRRLYALKTVSRKKIDRFEIQENLVLERKILLTLDHVFILKIVKSFKDSKRIYFLTEYVRGMDLFDVLREMNLISDIDAKFYVSCLLLILEYVHDRDIVYRDLKPENVIIDDAGYPKLIDFGISKILAGRTYTIVGTPHYMAPEIITGKGYTYSVDYWSLGIMLYEFVCCRVPFADEEDDPYLIYEKVLEHKLSYPSFLESRLHSKPLIEQLLSKNPVLRNGGSVDQLKSHPWLRSINWDNLISKQTRAPFVPKVQDLSAEVESALRISANIEESISKAEIVDDLHDSIKRRPKNIPPNWDQDF